MDKLPTETACHWGKTCVVSLSPDGLLATDLPQHRRSPLLCPFREMASQSLVVHIRQPQLSPPAGEGFALWKAVLKGFFVEKTVFGKRF